MIAYVDVWFSLHKIFAAKEGVADEREHAKDPRPEPKKSVPDPGVFSTNKKGKYYARKQDQHKHREDEQNPKCEQFEKDRLDDFQNLLLKILRKF